MDSKNSSDILPAMRVSDQVRELLRPKMNSEDDLQKAAGEVPWLFHMSLNDRNRGQVTDQVSRAIHFIAVISEVAAWCTFVIGSFVSFHCYL